MIKRIAGYTLIIFGLFVLWISTSTTAMEFISENRRGDHWWHTHTGRHGNLVGMAYLDFVEKFTSPPALPKSAAPKAGNAILYLVGDSYTYDFDSTSFDGLSAYHFVNRYFGGAYHLDTSKKNILIIEVAERGVSEFFSSSGIIQKFRDTATNQPASSMVMPAPARNTASFPRAIHISHLFNPRINQNLEFNLFNYRFIALVFQSKAAINYYFFKRASGNVVISRDGNFLFEKSSVSLTDPSSSYAPVNAEQISSIVAHINEVYDHYKGAGFHEVYLSVIPSTPSLVQPEGYNNLVPLIQNNTGNRMKMIDIYSALKTRPEVYFSNGDTHWSGKGEYKWVEIVNKILAENQ